jgi:hypothetical protein
MLISGLAVLLSSSLLRAQNNPDSRTACFANVILRDTNIVIQLPDLAAGGNFRMLPQVFFKGVFYETEPFPQFCSQSGALEKDVLRIQTHLSAADFGTIESKEQLVILNELILCIIWKNVFRIAPSELEYSLSQIEKNLYLSNQESFNLVNNLYHQAFDGK